MFKMGRTGLVVLARPLTEGLLELLGVNLHEGSVGRLFLYQIFNIDAL